MKIPTSRAKSAREMGHPVWNYDRPRLKPLALALYGATEVAPFPGRTVPGGAHFRFFTLPRESLRGVVKSTAAWGLRL